MAPKTWEVYEFLGTLVSLEILGFSGNPSLLVELKKYGSFRMSYLFRNSFFLILVDGTPWWKADHGARFQRVNNMLCEPLQMTPNVKGIGSNYWKYQSGI